VPPTAKLSREEVYGPVMALYPVDSLDEAVDRANEVAFGLHAAIFTSSLASALSAAHRLEVGGVIINDSTDYRVDTMPFGGFRMSGLGREGIDHAVASMTETRTIIMRG
jgi:glyceraldehyde-3-phosphate dehydrogenase (NADP+)